MDNALEPLQDALDLFQEVNDGEMLATVQNLVGNIHMINGDFLQAERVFLQSLSVRQRWSRKKNCTYSQSLAIMHSQLSKLYFHMGDFEQAKNHLEDAICHHSGTSGKNSVDIHANLTVRGQEIRREIIELQKILLMTSSTSPWDTNRLDEIWRTLEDFMEFVRKQYVSRSFYSGRTDNNKAAIAILRGNYDQAKELLESCQWDKQRTSPHNNLSECNIVLLGNLITSTITLEELCSEYRLDY